MPAITRRNLLRSAAALPLFAITGCGKGGKQTDISIESVDSSYEDFTYRVPIKFGGSVVDKVTLLNVNVTVKNRSGKTAKGFGSMPLGNVWSFPSKTLTYDETLNAMKQHATRMQAIIQGYKEFGHPVDHGVALEPVFLKAALEVNQQLTLKEPIPKLCTLVTASPFDAAIHDAFGKLYGLSCYKTYGSDFMTKDLSHYLGPKFKGEFLDQPLEQDRGVEAVFEFQDQRIRQQRRARAGGREIGLVPWPAPQLVIEGEPDRTPARGRDPRGATILDLTDRMEPPEAEPVMEPLAGSPFPGAIRHQPAQLRHRKLRAALGDQTAGLELPFEKGQLAAAVAADAELAPTERAATLEDIEARGVEVQARDGVAVAGLVDRVRVGSQVRSGPFANLIGHRAGQPEFQLGGELAVFALIE